MRLIIVMINLFFLSVHSGSAFAHKNELKQSMITIDGVRVVIKSSALPDAEFTTPQPDDIRQLAMAATHNPYRDVMINAIPFGRRIDNLPIAQSGSAAVYRVQREKDWGEHTQAPDVAPAIHLFGMYVRGKIYHVTQMLDSLTAVPTLIGEWIVEAGSRVWIVDQIWELGANPIQTTNDFLAQMSGTEVLSTELSNAIPFKGNIPPVVPHLSSADALPTPPWWNGTVCDTSHYGSNSIRLGSSYRNVLTCGPRPFSTTLPDVGVSYRGFAGLEWECVELSMRFMWLAYGTQTYYLTASKAANIVIQYNNTGVHLDKISNGTSHALDEGDVLAFGVSVSPPYGHTAVVSGVTIDGNGNGSIVFIEQNASFGGLSHLNVSGWYVAGGVTGWLHNPNRSNSGGGNPIPPTTNAIAPSTVTAKYKDGSMSEFAVASDGHIWRRSANAAGNWLEWFWFGDNDVFAPVTPLVVTYSDGSLDMIMTGKDGRMWHNWSSGADDWIGWNYWSNGTGLAITAPTLVKYADGALDVLTIGKDGHMWHKWRAATGSDWQEWQWFGDKKDNFLAIAPTFVRYANGALDVLALSSDGHIWHRWASSAGDWLNWNWFGTQTGFATATPTLVTYANGALDIVTVGNDKHMWHRWASSAGDWLNWNWFGSSDVFASAAPAFVRYDNRALDLIAVARDGHLWHRWASSAGDWLDWNWFGSTDSFANATPTLLRYDHGALDLFIVDNNGRMWHRWASSASDWLEWNWWSTSAPFAH